MQILVSYPRQKGFTLLELLVALGLFTAISTVVVPGLLQMYESVTRATELEGIVVSINSLGRESFDARRSMHLTGDKLPMPDGWRLQIPNAIFYSAMGVCHGGLVEIFKDDQLQLRETLSPPYCQMRHD